MAKQVYLSSTYKDLSYHRAKILETFAYKGLSNKYEFLAMERYVAESGKSGLDVSLEDVEKVDIYILILAGSYGTMANEDISFTEAEYERAKKLQKDRPGLYDVFVFYSAAEFERLDSADAADLNKTRLKNFYKKVMDVDKNACFTHPFDNPDNLCNQILVTLNYAYEPMDSADDYDDAIMLIDRKPPSKQFKSRYRRRQSAIFFGSSYLNNPNDFLRRMYEFEMPHGYSVCTIETAQLQASDYRKFKLKFMGLLPDSLSDGLTGFDFDSNAKVFISLQVSGADLKTNQNLPDFLELLLLDFLPGFLSEARLENDPSIFCLFYNYRENDEELTEKFSVLIERLNSTLREKAPLCQLEDISDLDDVARSDIRDWLSKFIRIKRFSESEVDKILKTTGSEIRDTFNMTEVNESLKEWISNILKTQKNADNRQ